MSNPKRNNRNKRKAKVKGKGKNNNSKDKEKNKEINSREDKLAKAEVKIITCGRIDVSNLCSNMNNLKLKLTS